MQRIIRKLPFLCCLALLCFAGCSVKDSGGSSEVIEVQNTAETTVSTVTAVTTQNTIATETTTSFYESITQPVTSAPTETDSSQGGKTGTTVPKSTGKQEPATTTAAVTTDAVSAPYAGLYSAKSMTKFYGKSTEKHIYPASLTKVLTACTALHYVSPDTVFTVGSELKLVPSGSSLCLIRQGHKLTLRDLLTGMLMSSGNDAAYTTAVNVARTVSENQGMSDADAVKYFVGLMNDYAADVGMKDSRFVNPDGWDNAEQYSTVHDLAVITAHAMESSEIRSIASCYTKRVVFASGEKITWTSTNALLNPDSKYYLPQAIGLKTGTTQGAGNCLIAVLEVMGSRYIAIVSGCADNAGRYGSVHAMAEMLL